MNSSPKHGLLDSGLRLKLRRLREMLQLDKDLEEVSTYFHAVLVPDDDFVMAGTRTHNARLVQALHAVLNTLAPGGESCAPLILRIEQERMCHGYATWRRGHAIFFYFEALEMGLCSFSPSLHRPEVTFSRFTLTATASGWNTLPRGSA